VLRLRTDDPEDDPRAAETELIPIFPAALVLTAFVARDLQFMRFGPADTAQESFTWYSVRLWTLWVLLITLPLATLVNGCVVLFRNSSLAGYGQIEKQPFAAIRTQLPTQIIAVATLVAGVILAVVVLHMLAN
jgi:heme/copper-type cytochrome/quinol oxidase subunit 2